jgi:hypothetical protein
MANVLQGMQYIQQQGELGRERGQRERLQGLAPQIIAGDTQAFEQGAAIDPKAAQAYQGAGDQQLRRLKGAIDYFEQGLQSGDDRLIQARFREISPFLTKFTGRPGPEAWTPDMQPAFEQVKTKIAMAAQGGKEQRNLSVSPGSAIVDPATGQVVYERPYTPSNQTINVAGPDGRPVQYTFNTRTAAYEPAALGAPGQSAPGGQPGGTQFIGPDGVPTSIGADVPPAIRQDIMNNTAGWNAAPDMGTAQLPPQQAQGVASPFVGRRPEDEAAAVEAAKQAAQLQTLPARQSIETQGAIERERGVGRVRADVESETSAQNELPNVMEQTTQIISLLDKAITHPGRSLVTGMSGLVDPRAYLRGGPAADFKALSDQLKGRAFLEAFASLKGGGQISNIEGQKAEQAMARLDTAQSDEAYVEALKELKQIASRAQQNAIERVSSGGRQPAPSAGQQPASDIDALLDMYR